MKPLLTLCMMVKNEAHGIARTLQSAKPWIDRWCILDTGSTDGTQDIIASVMHESPHVGGGIWEEPFVDFATSRNSLLDAASLTGADFLLLLDADDVLEGGAALRAFLESEPSEPEEHEQYCDGWACAKCSGAWKEPSREAFYLAMHQSGCEWTSARVVRADAVGPNGWRYVGAVHEVLCKDGAPPPSITIPGVRILHDPPARSMEASRARWERDAALLLPDAEKGDPRAVFYLAETLRRLGREQEACKWYVHRVALGGWHEEVCMSMLWVGRLTRAQDSEFWLLRSHAADPRRAEPLYELARRNLDVAIRKRGADGATWSRQPEDALAYLFARRAWELPKPQGALFVDAEVYAWKAADVLAQAAWWLGEWEIGERAARAAAENGPPDGAEQRARNLGFYLERKAAR